MKPNASQQTGIQVRKTPLDCLLVTFATAAFMFSGIDGSAMAKAHATEASTVNAASNTSLQSEPSTRSKGFESTLNPTLLESNSSATAETNSAQIDSDSSSEMISDDLMTVVRILMTLF